ncbi:MAG: DNA mismatch repair protein MutS [Candidatus Azosocius agrarius]|nr:MAG: DNA mismatch repair protein MutS [Gammaproteobacteria bacterium]
MKQYASIKKNYEKELILFRVGDFYELFYHDAKIASNILQIVLTKKKSSKNEDIPMAGIPYHAATFYIKKLLKNKQTIVIVEQENQENKENNLIKRTVKKILTPGTLIEEEYQEENESNTTTYIYNDKEKYYLASINISLGEFYITDVNTNLELVSKIDEINPSEIIITQDINLHDISNKFFINKIISNLNYSQAYKLLTTNIENNYEIIQHKENKEIIISAAIVYNYALKTQNCKLNHIKHLNFINNKNHIIFGPNTLKHLEIFVNKDNEKENTLYNIINKTKTPMGSRMLKNWLSQPIKCHKTINNRLKLVEILKKNQNYLELQDYLKNINDMEKIISKINLEKAYPKDLISLKNTLLNLPYIINHISNINNSPLLSILKKDIKNYSKITYLIKITINDDYILKPSEDLIINPGFNKNLDKLKQLTKILEHNIHLLQMKEQKATKNKNLKIKYNNINGYYIEITKSHCRDLPSNYIDIQSLKNSKKYYTEELKLIEYNITKHKEEIKKLEKSIYLSVITIIKKYTNEIKETAKAVAQLDILCNFSERADTLQWVNPKLTKKKEITLIESRHPLIENNNKTFITNDVKLDSKNLTYIVTGPNMGGKSTYLRQIAITIILAHIGCYVPAKEATISTIDQILTRMGAGDNLTRGYSTFMIEMIETANILKKATNNSLVLLDEIGRGTSILDGLPLAWAITLYLNKIKAFTLLTTHYYELHKLKNISKTIKNIYCDVIEYNNEIKFLYKMKDGESKKSFGIEVANIAGVSKEVIELAYKKQKDFESQLKLF